MRNNPNHVADVEAGSDSPPFVISIQHTGTRFTKRLLGDVIHCHVQNDRVFDKAIQYEGHTVSPLRDPKKVLVSWVKRNKPIEKFLPTWERWMELHTKHQFKLLPVDHRERHYFLDKLAADLGIGPLETGWAPVTENPHLSLGRPLPEIDLSPIYKFLLLEGINYGTH